MSNQFHTLQIQSVRNEIGGKAKSVTFEVPEEHREAFHWKSGQHITIKAELNGEEINRSYTISSSSDAGEPLRITVKRVKKGRMSNLINDTFEPGNTVRMRPPSGRFVLAPDSNERKTYYFICAGSGITPMYSMIRSVLTCEPHSVAHLIYGNVNHKTIIFKDELDAMLVEYSDRLSVSHVLSKPSMFSSFSPWRTGNIDHDTIGAMIKDHPPYAQDTQYYICGPGDMNQSIHDALVRFDVPSSRIHSESFGGGSKSVRDQKVGVDSIAKIQMNGERLQINIQSGQCVLYAMKKAGKPPEFSCESGVCGSCKAKLNKGSVHMQSHAALDEEQINRGEILTCQAVPTTESVEISFS